MRFVRASLGTRQLTHQHNLGAQGRTGAGAVSCRGQATLGTPVWI